MGRTYTHCGALLHKCTAHRQSESNKRNEFFETPHHPSIHGLDAGYGKHGEIVQIGKSEREHNCGASNGFVRGRHLRSYRFVLLREIPVGHERVVKRTITATKSLGYYGSYIKMNNIY